MLNHEQCAAYTDYWRTQRCPEPIDGRDGGCFCTAHAISCCREQMSAVLLAGDYELADQYASDLALLEGREIHELAKAA